MLYTIRHVTRFRYDSPISESVMEVRKQPLSDGAQRCVSFEISTKPRAKVHSYTDSMGNTVHHFDVPQAHVQLEITTQALVESLVEPPAADFVLNHEAWQMIDQQVASGMAWDYSQPSRFVQYSPLLRQFAAELNLTRDPDPLTLVRRLNSAINERLDYAQDSTDVDSTIDHALELRSGVCQDFTHIMLSVLRLIGIPSRYVSGYLFHRVENTRERLSADASHAWIEAWLPDLGWVGFDPTNNVLAGNRHLRVAVGRDYSDVPPTHGIFKGGARSKLEVAVQVRRADEKLLADKPSQLTGWSPIEGGNIAEYYQQQQQQQ